MLWLTLKTQCFFLFDSLRSAWRYYGNRTFAKVDLHLSSHYFFHNPFRISRRFLEKTGEEEVYAYGETPLTTLEQICKEFDVSSDDTVFELGCGRGMTCFWLNIIWGCNVVGVEMIPEFVEAAQSTVQKYHLKNIRFRLDDMFESDLSGATVIYLYGTCLKDHEIQRLAKTLSGLPPGTKIITTSYSLAEYTPMISEIGQIQGRFAWGTADVYLQEVSHGGGPDISQA